MTSSAWRYMFAVVGPGVSMLIAAVAVLAFAAHLEWSGASGADDALGMVLFLQLFAASTGYRDRLHRGHFDPVLTGRTAKWRIAGAHWLASTALGFATWAAVGVLELAVRATWPAAFRPAAMAVLVYASTVAWSASVAIGRYGGAVLWLLLLFAMSATQRLQALRVMFNPDPAGAIEIVRTMKAVIVFPVLLMLNPAIVGWVIVLLTAAAAVAAWTLGAGCIARVDATLRES